MAIPDKRILSRLPLWLALQAILTPAMALPNQPSPDMRVEPPKAVALPAPSKESISPQSDTLSTLAKVSSPEASAAVETVVSSSTVPGPQGAEAPSVESLSPLPAVIPGTASPLPTRRNGFRFGHRMGTENNMLGNLDGLVVDYGLGDFAFNGLAGFPTGNGGKRINPGNQLFGFSAGLRKLPKGWDLGGYVMEMKRANQNDRSALGGALRYTHDNRSLLISADYDLLHHSLSRFMVSSAWKPLPSSTISTTLDIRQSNLPTPQNSYLQQTIALTDGWKWGLPFDRINNLSANVTNDVTAFGFSLFHLLPRNIKLNSDIAVLNVSNEAALTDLNAPVPDFNEYYFNLTLSAKSLLIPGDNNRLTLRSYVSDTSRHSYSMFDGSYALSHQWLLAPKLKIDYRDNLSEHSTQWVASPALKIEYRWNKRSIIHFTTRGEWSKHQDSSSDAYDASYVVSLGYQTSI